MSRSLLANTNIKTLIYYFIGVASVLLISGVTFLHFSFRDVEGIWQDYQKNVVHKQTLFKKIESEFGYNGVIHNFKSYIVRPEKQFIDNLQNNIKNIDQYSVEFKNMGSLSSNEEAMLKETTNLLNIYNNKIKTVDIMRSEGASIERIDEAVEIDNNAFSLALSNLSKDYETSAEISHHELSSVLTKSELLLIAFIAFIGILMFGLKLLTEKRIMNPLDAVNNILLKISQGDLNVHIVSRNKDELGTLCQNVTLMRDNLISSKEETVQSLQKADTLSSTMEGLGTNILIADMDDNLTYANKQSFKNLLELTPEIRKTFANFDVTKLMGSSIHQFHKDPDRIRKILGALQPGHQHKAYIDIGTLKLSLNAGGVFATDGTRISTYVEWQDVTQQFKDEKQANTLSSTMEGLGTNVLITDENDVLSYANKQSIKNLANLSADIRKTFPEFDVNKLMGSSIHQFHKDPDRIRRILTALKPGEQHRGVINIGEIKLSLNAGGVFDRAGKRIGSYAEWNDVTHQHLVESRINETANAINTATQDISQGNLNLSERTESQAASIQETTASMQQITERVNETASNAQEVADLSNTTKDAADRGGTVVRTAITAMAEISESSKKINEIIGVIDEIAFQTNLLALNAAVEAARAGEQGRGFAVVASEVRNLAGRSAKAAKEIKELITDSVDKVEIGTAQVNETGECLDEIIMSVQQVTSMVNNITAATRDQAQGVEEVNKAVTQMDSFTQQNASLVEEAASASSALSEQAANLVAIISSDKNKGI